MTSSDKNNGKWTVKVGLASCGIAAGGARVYEAFTRQLQGRSDVELKQTGCLGMCYNEVLIEVAPPDGDPVFYKQVTPERVGRIVTEHLTQGNPVTEWVIPADELNSLLSKQKRIVLRNCGVIDPEDIDDYIDTGGYRAIEKALTGMSPQEVIKEVTESGLRGRGGAGFPTGVKWDFARKSGAGQKYVVCNADEGDPGAFMDRSVLESDPHSVIEGMLIAGYAIGATEGFLYVRAEYPLAIKRLEIALAQARERGYLGEGILGGKFDFNLSIRQGAGAFVCGEETALMMSIEGKRGMPPAPPALSRPVGAVGQTHQHQ
jgi:NADH-quinone oxidoreductase subunit F